MKLKNQSVTTNYNAQWPNVGRVVARPCTFQIEKGLLDSS